MMNTEVMKAKLLLTLALFLIANGLRAQGNQETNPYEGWDLKVSLSVISNDDVVDENKILNMPQGAQKGNIQVDLEYIRPESVKEDSVPKELWMKKNNGTATAQSYNVVNKKNGRVTISISTLSNQIGELSFSFSLTKNQSKWYDADKKLKFWKLPNDPTLDKSSYSTFEGYDFSVTANCENTELISKYEWKQDDKVVETANKFVLEGKAQTLGNSAQKTIPYTFAYSYGLGNKVWKQGSKPFNLTVYHKPEYKHKITVNEVSSTDAKKTVTHSDEVKLSYEKTFGGYGNNSNYSSKETTFTADNEGDHEIHKQYDVIITNTISNNIDYKDTLTYEITVLPKIDVERTIAENTMTFRDSTVILHLERKHNQTDLTWTYGWKNGNTTLSSKDSTCNVTKQLKTGSNEFKVDVTCKRGNKTYINKTLNYKIELLNDPQVTKYGDFEEDNFVTCHGQTMTMKIEIKGGNDNGWEFGLSSNNPNDSVGGKSERESKDKWIITYVNTSSKEETADFGITAKNTIPANESSTGNEQVRNLKNSTKTFKATIYPEPRISWKKGQEPLNNYFYGSVINLAVDSLGGWPTGWVWSWSKNEEIESIGERNYKFTVPESNGDSCIYDDYYLLTAENYYTDEAGGNKTLWGTKTIKVPFTAWKRAQLDAKPITVYNHEGNEDLNTYEGHNVTFKANTIGGYPRGWIYQWIRVDNNYLEGEKQPQEMIATLMNNSSDSEIQTYKLIVENRIPGLDEGEEKTFRDEDSIKITVWHNAEGFEDNPTFTIINQSTGREVSNAVREGNELTFSTTECSYGYNGDWDYIWDGSSITKNNEVKGWKVPTLSGDQKTKETWTCSLQVQNMGPDGIVWEQSNVVEKTFTIYKRPKTPRKLTKKGNSTSGTVIAIANLPDTQLQQYEYWLVFGQYNNSTFNELGRQQQQEPGQMRWTANISGLIGIDNAQLCVYALWIYSDGAQVTSGLCFADGKIDEVWDGSRYDGVQDNTRSGDDVASGISTASQQSGSPATVYGLNGTTRQTIQRGLNIIRMADGTVRKMIVK